jgi:hypothetical protein
MWPFDSLSKSYQPLKNRVEEEEEGESIDLDDLRFYGLYIFRPSLLTRPIREKPPQRKRYALIAALILAILCTTTVGVAYSYLGPKRIRHQDDSSPLVSKPTTTTGCALRREWRTLSQPEKDHYISSVKCLTTIPSKMKSDWTSYEDFPWIHSHVGYYTHHSAPFLPWHRYFLHIYEMTLREQCNFTGELVYWDWTRDWKYLEYSPVFDAESGFGGDGDKDGNITIGTTGRCVVDGPFTDIHAKYYDVKYKPHCLSRGFRDDEGNLGHMNGDAISPESIEEVLQLNDYERFVAEMESRVHDAIPFGIGGDFETFTAPYGKHSSSSFAWGLKS